MEKHPIENIMSSTLENIRSMINVDTVIGQPIETKTGAMIVPFSKVSFGFVSGGGEYDTNPNNQSDTAYPFAGGTGAGVCVAPVGFLTINGDDIRMLPVHHGNPYEKLIELVPNLINEIKDLINIRNNNMLDDD